MMLGAQVLVQLNDADHFDGNRSGIHINTESCFNARVMDTGCDGVMVLAFLDGKQRKRFYPWSSIRYLEVLEES